MYQYGIVGGSIVDGTGKAPYRANVYFENDRIAKITAELLPAEKIVDAAGLAVAPGFIDIHTHADVCPWLAPGYESYVHQGVTSVISGNCGGSLVPHRPEDHEKKARSNGVSKYGDNLLNRNFTATDAASYAKEITGLGAVNNGMLVGHGELRKMAMADPNAEYPTPEELNAMKEILRENLRQGAFGMSLGLEYIPGAFAHEEELIELAKVAKEFDVPVPVHMRSEGPKVFEAIDEMARVARGSGAHIHISHFKIGNFPGQMDRMMKTVDGYLAEGLNMTFDQYPYTASSTGLSYVTPKEFRGKPVSEMLRILEDDVLFAELKPGIEKEMSRRRPGTVVICYTHGAAPECDGKNLLEIGEIWGTDVYETIRRILIKTGTVCQVAFHSMIKEECAVIAKRMDVSVISDSSAFDFISKEVPGTPHPRNFGTFTHFLRWAREDKLMPLEKAIYKMTALPAATFAIRDRGQLREGFFADAVVFDPETVTDHGDYQHPAALSTGVKAVFVNGTPAFENGTPTGSRTGIGLLRQ